MTFITTDYKIAPNWNNAGSLVAITALTDANGVAFLEPQGLPRQSRGLRVFAANGTVSRIGKSRVVLTSNLLLAQWEYLVATYEEDATYKGLVTARLALSGSTFANYNAILSLQDFEAMDSVVFAADGNTPDFYGPGFRNAEWTFTIEEAL